MVALNEKFIQNKEIPALYHPNNVIKVIKFRLLLNLFSKVNFLMLKKVTSFLFIKLNNNSYRYV